jgi:hypothetical protein
MPVSFQGRTPACKQMADTMWATPHVGLVVQANQRNVELHACIVLWGCQELHNADGVVSLATGCSCCCDERGYSHFCWPLEQYGLV